MGSSLSSSSSSLLVTELAKRMASRPNAAAGRVILGTMQIKRLQALVYWVKDHDKRGLQAVPEIWTQEVMLAAIKQKESEQNLDKVDIDVVDPSKRQTDTGWDNWQIGFVNKLSAVNGAAKVPIDYIVRPKWYDTDKLILDDNKIRRFQMPLEGENLSVTTNWCFRYWNRLVFSPMHCYWQESVVGVGCTLWWHGWVKQTRRKS